MRPTLLIALIVFCASSAVPANAAGDAPYRFAVLIGANQAAPGRKKLRYAHEDAKATAAVLSQLAGFSAADVHVLEDPEPNAVLTLLDAKLMQAAKHREAMVFFYYSGHADGKALYPNGKPLPLAELRKRLDSSATTVRVGLIDACRGGGWTGTKGLSEADVFQVDLPLTLTNKGSALIASSSGLEDAHESETIKGSFFTHHWNASLRGAGDANADGEVTLNEAFAYAKALTIRDTALYARTPQHPSFHLNLSGRQDLTLARLSAGKTLVTVDQKHGPLQLVHLDSGVVLLEVPAGERKLKLAVAPGHYLVRRRSGKTIWAKQIHVAANHAAVIDEAQLQLVGTKSLTTKRAKPRPVTLSTLPGGMVEIQFAAGVRHLSTMGGVSLSGGSDSELALSAHATWGITDRLQWSVGTLAFAYRGGHNGGLEWIPWGGLLGWGFGRSSVEGTVIYGSLGAGIDLRWWLSERSSLSATLGFTSYFRWVSSAPEPCTQPTCSQPRPSSTTGPDTWRSALSLGYSHTLFDTVTFNFGVALRQNLLYEGEGHDFAGSTKEHDVTIAFGSVQTRGLRPPPLLRVHFGDIFSLDGHIALGYRFAAEKLSETYMLGATWIW